MIKVNEYLEGKVKSLGAEFEGEYFTTGIMLPGQYKFTAEKEERIVVTLGTLNIQLPGKEWKKVSKGEAAVVPPGVEFQLFVEKTVSYICFYK